MLRNMQHLNSEAEAVVQILLKNFVTFTGKHLCWCLFFDKVAGLMLATLLKKEALTQVFSSETCKIFKSTFFHRTPPVAASEETK